MRLSYWFCLLVMGCVGGLMVLHPVQAEPDTAVIPARLLSQPPAIDGVLDPDEWREAVRISPFWFLKDQREADLPTVCYLAYTREGIYAAFECHDPEPEKIMAQEIRRGADLSKDDYVELTIEPTGLGAELYAFRVSAGGTQEESIAGGSASNVQWRGDWKAAVSRHNGGWSAEIFVPFRILRIPRNQREFGVILARNVPRLNAIYYYPNMGVAFDALKRARWQGIQAPEVLPPPIILPYTQLDSTADRTDWRSGLDVKLTSSGGLITLLTLNPDFKNIAREVDSVSFSYVPRIVRETRPFFVEGDSFFPDTTLFYSGNVQAVDAALKSFGRLGRWSYGALASTGKDQRAVVGRLGYQFTERSQAEVQIVRDDRPGIHATALGGGAVFFPGFRDGFATIAMLYFRTESNLSPVGEKMQVSLWRERGDGRVSFGGRFWQVSRAFNPTLGYAPETGFRGYDVTLHYRNIWTDRPLQEINVDLYAQQRRNLDGGVLDEGIFPSCSVTFRNGMMFWISPTFYHRPPYRDRTLGLGTAWNYRRLYNSGWIGVSFGREAGGDSLFWYFSQGIPFTQRLRLNVRYERSLIQYKDITIPDRNQHQLIATLNYDIDAERSIGGRYIGRGSRFGAFDEINTLYLTYRQQVRRGMDIFLIFGDPNASSTQTRFAMKVIMPW
ncbi:MAG: hypothetical protein HPY54_06315 [Chthonomonadetes bacterium]|nr:hypothetical protein [Chthonomonadetes bacterium]